MLTKRLVLRFPQRLAGKPLVFKLARDYGMEFNILKADVTPDAAGNLVLEVRGEKENYERAIQFLTEAGVDVKPLSQDIFRDNELCTHCGVCIPLCPTDALTVDTTTREVDFQDEKCVVCGLCVKICPFHAMRISF